MAENYLWQSEDICVIWSLVKGQRSGVNCFSHFPLRTSHFSLRTSIMLPPAIIVFCFSMLPLLELRGSIPYGVLKLGMEPEVAFFCSILGNSLIALLILFSLKGVSDFLSQRSVFFKHFFDRLFAKTYLRHKKKFEVMEDLALVAIVAIPLPFTGAWTGSLAAFVFQIPTKRAFPLIVFGVIIAGVVVTLLTISGANLDI